MREELENCFCPAACRCSSYIAVWGVIAVTPRRRHINTNQFEIDPKNIVSKATNNDTE